MLVVPIFCNEVTLLPPSTQGVPVLPGKLSAAAYQLAPSLTNRIALLVCVSVHEASPSIVCEEVVAMVNTEELELAFFTQYSRPVIPAAVGNVRVAAEVPVNTNILSDVPAVVFPVNELIAIDKDPLTSSVEFGAVVPIPTWAFITRVDREKRINKNLVFIVNWILQDWIL